MDGLSIVEVGEYLNSSSAPGVMRSGILVEEAPEARRTPPTPMQVVWSHAPASVPSAMSEFITISIDPL